MDHITTARIHYNELGNPVSDHFGDVYFSDDSGILETQFVFLEKNQLPMRWYQFEKRFFHVIESGFGTGLNFLVCWQNFREFQRKAPSARCQQLYFTTFEKFPLSLADLKRAQQSWPELAELAGLLQQQYPSAIAGNHRLLFDQGAVTLDLWFGDIQQNLPLLNPAQPADAWFLDGFAPSKNPEMWQPILFENMARLSQAATTVATFTSAGIVRRGLQSAGFEVQKVRGFGRKLQMTIATMPPLALENGDTEAKSTIEMSKLSADFGLSEAVIERSATDSLRTAVLLPENIEPAAAEEMVASATDAITSDATPLPPKGEFRPATKQSCSVPPDNSEITLIGGGLASILLALSLIQQGQRVRILCQDNAVARQGSQNRQGALYPQLQSSFSLNSAFHAVAYEFAVRTFRNLQSQFNFTADFCGVLTLACNERLALRQQKIAQDPDFPTTLFTPVDANRASALAGITLPFGGLWFGQGGWIAPQRFCQAALTYLQTQAGFELLPDCELKQIVPQATGYLLHTSQGQMTAHRLVLCCGTALSQFTRLPVNAVRGQVSHVLATGLAELKTVLCHRGYITPGDTEFALQSSIGATFDREASQSQGIRFAELTLADDQANLQLVNQVLQQPTWFADAKVVSATAAFRATVPDHLPLYGEIAANCYVLGGLGARGLLFAPLLAAQLAAELSQQPAPMTPQFSTLVAATRFQATAVHAPILL